MIKTIFSIASKIVKGLNLTRSGRVEKKRPSRGTRKAEGGTTASPRPEFTHGLTRSNKSKRFQKQALKSHRVLQEPGAISLPPGHYARRWTLPQLEKLHQYWKDMMAARNRSGLARYWRSRPISQWAECCIDPVDGTFSCLHNSRSGDAWWHYEKLFLPVRPVTAVELILSAILEAGNRRPKEQRISQTHESLAHRRVQKHRGVGRYAHLKDVSNVRVAQWQRCRRASAGGKMEGVVYTGISAQQPKANSRPPPDSDDEAVPSQKRQKQDALRNEHGNKAVVHVEDDYEEGDDDDEESSEEKNATYDPELEEDTDLDGIAEDIINHCTEIWCLTSFNDDKNKKDRNDLYQKVIKTLAFARTQFIVCNKFIKDVPKLRKFLEKDGVFEIVLKCRVALKKEREKEDAKTNVSKDFEICYEAVDKTVKLFKRAKRQLPK